MTKLLIILFLVIRCSDQSEPGIYVGLLTGGYSGPVTASVEVLGGECRVSDLPQPMVGHLTLVTEDSKVLVCGGRDGSKNYIQTCREYDAKSKEWKYHSDLNERRYRASGASLQSQTMILGGGGGRGSEFLASGSSVWRSGPALPGGASWGACAVAVSASSLLLIGGRSQREVVYLNQVAQFSVITNSWTQWDTLSVARLGHACHKLGSTVVVAGGITFGGVVLKSTEIIDLNTEKSSKAFDMVSPRHGFGMTELGRGAHTLLLAFGTAGSPSGGDFDWSLSRSAEEWNAKAGNWTFSPIVMKTRSFFGAATVDANLVCVAGEGAESVEGELWSFCRDWKPSSTGRDGRSMENDTVEFCGQRSSDRITKRGVRSCYTLPCYALNHCPRYITRPWMLNSFPCCCAHPVVRREKWRSGGRCNKMNRA